LPSRQRFPGRAIYGSLCPGLGVRPAGSPRTNEFYRRFSGGFVGGESGFELGEDFGGGFDGEEGEAVYVAKLKANPRIQRR